MNSESRFGSLYIDVIRSIDRTLSTGV